MLSSEVILRDSFPVCCTITLPTVLLEIDEKLLTSLDSVLTIPDPLSPLLKEQAPNRLKAAKHAAKLYSLDLFELLTNATLSDS